MTPVWRDRPEVPGAYVILAEGNDFPRLCDMAWVVRPSDYHTQKWVGYRFYGPIPPDQKETP